MEHILNLTVTETFDAPTRALVVDYQSTCSCGWTSEPTDDEDTDEWDREFHPLKLRN